MRRVLHVEDEALLTTTVRMLLAPAWETVACSTVKDALAALSDATLEAVVCDLALPDGTASDVYRAIVTERPDLRGRFVVTTGGATSEETERFLVDHDIVKMAKPFDIDELADLLTKLTAP